MICITYENGSHTNGVELDVQQIRCTSDVCVLLCWICSEQVCGLSGMTMMHLFPGYIYWENWPSDAWCWRPSTPTLAQFLIGKFHRNDNSIHDFHIILQQRTTLKNFRFSFFPVRASYFYSLFARSWPAIGYAHRAKLTTLNPAIYSFGGLQGGGGIGKNKKIMSIVFTKRHC